MTALPAEDAAALPGYGEEDSDPGDGVTFASLGVPAPIVDSLARTGITSPFPVQAATLPDALASRDVLGRAQTGSGKTLGFSIPLVARLAGGSTEARHPRGLVLVPTRELASQVEDVLVPLARAMGLRVATIYGGVSYRPQIIALDRATDILVACPGRLEDLINQGHCDLSGVEITVIDEADQMADLGFLPIVRRLLEATPDDGQRMLFSATLDGAIDVLAKRFLTDPARHSVDENSSPAEIEHHVITIGAKQRMETVAALAGGEKRSLVFTRTKHGAQRLARQLTEAGIPAAELHGNLRQGARAKNLAAFASGIAQVMVATDIAARGIHVDGIELVIHADPPAEHKAYVHRSGRTARGGADGVVVTLQTAAQAREVRRLMREAGVTARQAEAAPDSEVLRDIAGEPAPRVQLAKPVTDMVKLPKRHPASGGDDSRPADGRRGDRRRRDRRGGDRWGAEGRRSGTARRRPDRFDERRGESDARRADDARGEVDGRPGDRRDEHAPRQRPRDGRESRDRWNDRESRTPRDRSRDDRESQAPRDRSREDRWADRSRDSHQARDRFRDDRTPDRRFRDDRNFRDERNFRDDRGSRDDRSFRDDRNFRDDRGSRDDRGPRYDQGSRDNRGPRGDWTPGGDRGRRGPDRDGRGRDWTPAKRGGQDSRTGERARDSWTPANRQRDGWPARDRARDEWTPDRRERRDERNYDDRGGDRGDQRGGNSRSWQGNSRSWERNGRPARPGGTGRHQASDDRRPSWSGGRPGRPEFPGRPGAARKRRNSGQGRHF